VERVEQGRGTRCRLRSLGRADYLTTLALQEQLVEDRLAERCDDTLLLLEHDPVITLGRGCGKLATPLHERSEHLKASAQLLQARGVALCESPRGGDITFHGPGQLVAYPILKLPPERHDVRRYVWDVEEVVIRTLADYGVTGERVEGLRGIWVGADKVAAVGIRLSRWVTSHGLALNVSTDLSYFELITPCGIRDRGVTSLARLLGCTMELEPVQARLCGHFAEVFGVDLDGG
jgi:lipoyl(octanoyl) transferase